jgi:integral membrane sensor domain MASE1
MATVFQLAGLIAVTTGAALIAPAAGFIVGGVLLTMFGVALERARGAE